jgi:hypothetical protein
VRTFLAIRPALKMTATDLSKVAGLLEQDSLPSGLREEIDRRTGDILNALKRGQSSKLTGPHGEELVIVLVPEPAGV